MVSKAPPAFQLPAALRSRGFALRPETERDIPFLFQLYASTREDELAPTGWAPEQKLAFLDGQFRAQRHHYRTYLTSCAFDILEHDGTAAGRLYLEARATQLYIADIALLPAWRGQGVGTAILKALMADATAQDTAVGIMVEKFNPALRLYRRLGFADIADHGVYLEMEWRPAGARAVN